MTEADMAALPEDSDLTNINEPKTNREVILKIVRLVEEASEDRADDRDLIESFIKKQDSMNEKMDVRLKCIETSSGVYEEMLSSLKEASKKWDVINSAGVILVAILTALGLKGS
jgi:membrane-bound ClpP family serine protease